jgi:hypothetical protein
MKPIYLLLVVVGLALGPGYWIHAKFFSGELVQTLQLHAAQGGGLVTPGFHLRPDMQPAGLILKAQGSFAPNMDEAKPPRNVYLAQINRDGQPFKEVGVTLAVKSVSDSNPAFLERLLWLEAVPPGAYQVLLTPRAAPEIALDQVRLEVRAHIQEPDGRVVAAGALLLIVGAMALFMG